MHIKGIIIRLSINLFLTIASQTMNDPMNRKTKDFSYLGSPCCKNIELPLQFLYSPLLIT